MTAWFAASAIVALALPAFGADVVVRGTIEPAELILGDRAVLSVAVEGDAGDVGTPRIPETAGLTIKSAGPPSQSTRLVNGRLVHKSLTYRYAVWADQVGEYTVPPFEVDVDGRTLRTRQLTLRVIKAPEGGPSRLTVEVTKTECWQFEPIEVIYKWALRSDIKAANYEMVLPLLGSRNDMTVELVKPPQGASQELVASGVQLEAALSQERIEDATFGMRTLRFRVYPQEYGELVILPASVTTIIGVPTNRRDIWGERLYDRTRAVAATESKTVLVKALPTEGRPEHFDGAVGRFAISTKISDPRAHVDDPLRLAITVEGDGLLGRVKRPLLSELPDFADRFRITETLEPGEAKDGRVVFEQIIRPKNADVNEIPPVSFAYFDPDSGTYQVVQSDPIPITVLPTTAQSIETFGAHEPEPEATELTRRPGGLYANVTSYAALRDQTPSLTPLWVLLVPPIAFAVVFVAVRRRRMLNDNLALARASAAYRTWRSRVADARRAHLDDGAAFFDTIARAVSGYLSDKLNLGQGELTTGDISTLIDEGQLPDELGAAASAILGRCDAARFTRRQIAEQDRRELIADAEAFGRTAERALRRRR